MGVRGTSTGPKVNLSVRVSLREGEILRKAAAERGIYVSEFLLQCALREAETDFKDRHNPVLPDRSAMVWDRR